MKNFLFACGIALIVSGCSIHHTTYNTDSMDEQTCISQITIPFVTGCMQDIKDALSELQTIQASNPDRFEQNHDIIHTSLSGSISTFSFIKKGSYPSIRYLTTGGIDVYRGVNENQEMGLYALAGAKNVNDIFLLLQVFNNRDDECVIDNEGFVTMSEAGEKRVESGSLDPRFCLGPGGPYRIYQGHHGYNLISNSHKRGDTVSSALARTCLEEIN